MKLANSDFPEHKVDCVWIVRQDELEVLGRWAAYTPEEVEGVYLLSFVPSRR
jgi:hypothetical protein